MFRRRLHLALGSLALAALLQGGVSWWAIQEAGRQVVRGRVAADIQNGFMALSATKARLRVWAAEATLEGTAEPQRKQQLLNQMAGILHTLQSLTDAAEPLLAGEPAFAVEQHARREALRVLATHLDDLQRAMAGSEATSNEPSRLAAWQKLNQAFDVTQGQDLRTLLANSLQRERDAAQRERTAADRSLMLVQAFALGATLTLALAALLASVAFSRGLRRPLDALRAGAEALQQGDLGHRIRYLRVDEFGDLARTVNSMADQLEQHRAREHTARQELETQVRARTAELQDALHAVQLADARRRQLLADVSHELRTPTTAIRGEAEIALRGQGRSPDDYRIALKQIADAARHLGKVIDDLLTLARIETEALPLKLEPMDATLPLREACDQARAAAEHRRVRLQRPEGAEVPVPVAGDAARLRQVFTILLDNAIQYSRADTMVEVVCALQPLPDGRPGWEVCIRDQGIGIPAAELPHVMSRHFRGEHAPRMAPDGLGLGLSLAHGIVRAHGGWLDLDSTPGCGTEVRVVLPCHS